jgi:hypothetical protein
MPAADDLLARLARAGGVRPRYEGQSLLNVPASIAAALGAPGAVPAPPLDPAVLPPAMLDGVAAVVLLVVDGLGRWQLEAAIAAGDAPALGALAGRAAGGAPEVALASITSVVPSSTVPALTTLATGLPPADHGLIGWTVHLDELGEAAELARWGPAAGHGSYRDPARGGRDPVAFLARPTVYQRLAAAGVRSAVVCPAAFEGSGLSAMTYAGAAVVGYRATSSLPVLVDRLLAARRPGERLYVHAYWGALDTVGHHHGPDSGEHREELAALDLAVGRWLARHERRGDVLALLTADHGHVPTDPARVTRLDAEPALLADLRAPPTGERRLVYLHARPDRGPAVQAYCRERLGHAVEVVPAEEALRAGLLGPGPVSEAARRRAGDLMLLARDGHQLDYPLRPGAAPLPFAGNHGALDPREMVVPLLTLRL